jgi:hypothetical protein
MATCRMCSDRPDGLQAEPRPGTGRSAVLLLRVWQEGDDLRCRLLQGTSQEGVVAQGVDAICDAVRRWLLEMAART